MKSLHNDGDTETETEYTNCQNKLWIMKPFANINHYEFKSCKILFQLKVATEEAEEVMAEEVMVEAMVPVQLKLLR